MLTKIPAKSEQLISSVLVRGLTILPSYLTEDMPPSAILYYQKSVVALWMRSVRSEYPHGSVGTRDQTPLSQPDRHNPPANRPGWERDQG